MINVQITLSANNMWGIIHMIVELLMKHEDGKYVMMKVIYAVPLCRDILFHLYV